MDIKCQRCVKNRELFLLTCCSMQTMFIAPVLMQLPIWWREQNSSVRRKCRDFLCVSMERSESEDGEMYWELRDEEGVVYASGAHTGKMWDMWTFLFHGQERGLGRWAVWAGHFQIHHVLRVSSSHILPTLNNHHHYRYARRAHWGRLPGREKSEIKKSGLGGGGGEGHAKTGRPSRQRRRGEDEG